MDIRSKKLYLSSIALIISVFGFFLSACDTDYNYAPVTEISTIEPIPRSGVHRVTEDETFYEIAWRYGLDYRVLAARNRIKPPYAIEEGQIIHLRPITSANNLSVANDNSMIKEANTTQVLSAIAKKRQTIASHVEPAHDETSKRTTNVTEEREPNFFVSHWMWPAHGKIMSSFSSSHKGINIVGREGDPIYAAAPGKVVYAGDGLIRFCPFLLFFDLV